MTGNQEREPRLKSWWSHFFHPKKIPSSIPWRILASYQEAGYEYLDPECHRHQDSMSEVYRGTAEDRCLSTEDAKLIRLVVQATHDVYNGDENSTWRRTYMRDVGPRILRVANWPMSGLDSLPEGTRALAWAFLALKWLPACVTVFPMVRFHPSGLCQNTLIKKIAARTSSEHRQN